MKLVELSPTDQEQYNRFVAESPSGSFLQAWEWGQWQEQLGREVVRFFILEKNNHNNHNNYDDNILGSVQLIKMRLFGKKFYWYAPYGPVVSQESRVNSQELLRQLRNNLVGAVFIRIEPKDQTLLTIDSSLITKSTNIQPGKSLIIDLSKSTDQLLQEMHPKTRYNIKLAQKHGVKIQEEFGITVGHGLFFDEALKLILETSKRQHFSTFSAAYYQQLVDFFAVKNQGEIKAHIYKAIYQKQLLSAAIMVEFGTTRTFLFGGSADEHKNVMAPYLLHWQAMSDAKTAGLCIYDFWGIETAAGEVPGFVRFKLGFGGEQKHYLGCYDIVCDRLWYKLYGFARKVNRQFKKASR